MSDQIKKTIPNNCPGCGHVLSVAQLKCDSCTTTIDGNFQFSLLTQLNSEEQEFILTFLKSSGSLKDIARIYGLSYPTVRNRLDSVIEKIRKIEASMDEKEGE